MSTFKLNSLESFEDVHSLIVEVASNIENSTINVETLIGELKRKWDGSQFERRKYTMFVCDHISSKMLEDPDYDDIVKSLYVRELHLRTPSNVRELVELLRTVTISTIRDDILAIYDEYGDDLDEMVNYDLDYKYNYFAVRTMEKMYSIKVIKNGSDDAVAERPQHTLMRVAVGICQPFDIDVVREFYENLSNHMFTMATPVNFNAGTKNLSMASCFLLDLHEDSIDGIYKTLHDTAMISKNAGGIGINLQKLRSSGTAIAGTNGRSDGIVPLLKVLDAVARHVTQGGRRAGSIAGKVEPSHPDFFGFLDASKPHGVGDEKALSLFHGVWVPELVMKRVQSGGQWSMFDPSECPELLDKWGDEYDEIYVRLESDGRARKTMPAQDVFKAIVECQIETGRPYMLAKDTINRTSNQSNVGIIKSSNLCAEVVEVTSPDHISVCNLGSMSLPAFVRADGTFDFEELGRRTEVLVKALNMVIIKSTYPCKEANSTNTLTKPMGIGSQGLAKALIMMRIPYSSERALELTAHIQETVYYHAVKCSMEMARVFGAWDEGIQPSPLKKGVFHFDHYKSGVRFSGKYNWDALRKSVMRHGTYNSLFVAIVPTATTSQILNNTEACEQITSNIYIRKVLGGEFVVVNKFLVDDLKKLGVWNKGVIDSIKSNAGSIQQIDGLPADIKELYLTAWETPQKWTVDHALARSPFVDQSQSNNLFFGEPTIAKISNALFRAWKNGVKTMCYYTRTRSSVSMQSFSVVPKTQEQLAAVCRRDNPEGCVMCSA